MEGTAQHVQHAARAGLGPAGAGQIHEQDEFVTAQAGHRVGLAHTAAQPLGHVDQHAVAEGMAQCVVDVLEAVEVQEQQRKLPVLSLRLRSLIMTSLGLSQARLEALGQQAPVGQAGERVGGGQRFDAFARGDLLGDVAERINPPDRPALAALRQAHAFDHLARMQLQHVAGLQHRGFIQGGQPPHVGGGVHHAATHPVQQGIVVALQQQLGRQVPHLCKAPVAVADAAGEVGDEDAIGRRFQRRLQLRRRKLELALRALLFAAVMQGHHVKRRTGIALHAADTPGHRHGGAIESAHQGFRLDAVACAFGHLAPEAQVFGRGRQLQRGAAQQFCGRQAQQLAGRAVGTDDVQAPGIHQPHGVEHGFHHRRHALQRLVIGTQCGHAGGGGSHDISPDPVAGSRVVAAKPAGSRVAGSKK